VQETRALAGEIPYRPPLKWAGGKRWQLPLLESLWGPHRSRRLVEPFCGGLAVTLGLRPRRALLNDVNEHLINFYRWLQRGFAVTIPMRNDRALYYRHRTRFNSLLENGSSDSAEAASLFYFLNRSGYNGLCRFNRRGAFNVPFGRYRTIAFRRDFSEYATELTRWEFVSGDFADLRLNPDDFVYADPPYDVEFRAYAQNGFTWRDQVRAAEWLASHPGPVVLVNQATPRIRDLYAALGFDVDFLSGPRRINCTGDRTPAREIVALRNISKRT
jgi:DNA adenine methylase